MKIKTKDGQEVEVSDTFLLEQDELFLEAAKMRGLKLPAKGTTAQASDDVESRITSIVEQKMKLFDNSLKSLAQTLEDEKKVRASATAEVQKQLTEQKAKAITVAIDSALKAGKITPANVDKWKARLEKDFDTQSEVLGEIPATTAQAQGKASQAQSSNAHTPASTNDYVTNQQQYLNAAQEAFASTKSN